MTLDDTVAPLPSHSGGAGLRTGRRLGARLFIVCALAGFGPASCRGHGGEHAHDGGPDGCTTGCVDGGRRPDAGFHDAGNHDAGARDAATQDGGGADAGFACAPFPSFRRDCETAADCALAFETYNCCGSQLVTGVRADQLAAFNQAAQYCEAQFPACGCASQPTRADDGTVDDLSNSVHPSLTCQNHQCWSSFATFSGRTPCGSQGATCDAATEICRTSAGPGPSAPSACVAIPQGCETNRTCDCLRNALCTGITNECFEDVFANAILCECTLCQ